MNLPATKHDMLYGILEGCYDDPLMFVEEVLGAKPTEQQKEGLREIAKEGARVSIRSGHNTGKTTLLAWVILWWVITRYDCKIPITANTGGQLRDNLWPEIHKWRECLPPEIRDEIEITTERIYIKSAPQMQFGVPRTARKENPEALQGFHAKHLLFILDESSGIDEVVFEVARASLSNPGARILMASNPTRTSGYFYQSHHEHRNRWTPLHWSCLDSPLPAENYAREVIEDYGEDSNYYRVRVLGDFPTTEFDQFIPLELVEAAAIREDVIAEGPVIWGLDPAWMGADETALAIRQGDVIGEIKGVRGLDTMQTVGWVVNEYRETKAKPDLIVVDSIGIGAGVYDRLRELNYPVVACNVAESPSGVNKYLNVRAELWDKYKEWLQARRGSIPNDKKLIGQSSVVKYEYRSQGKLQIESKANMRKRGVHSPDRADAVCLTFYQQPLLMADYEDDDDDYRPFKAEGRSEVTGYCYSDDTEILTNTGWKYFRNLLDNEVVLTMNPQNKILEYHKIVKRISLPYKGEMLSWNSKSISISVTPTHHMFVTDKNRTRIERRGNGVKETFVVASDIPLRASDRYSVPLVGCWNHGSNEKINISDSIFLNPDVYAALMGIFLSEGSTQNIKYKRIQIPQKHWNADIENILQKTPFSWKWYSGNGHTGHWLCSSPELFKHLSPIKYAHEKRVPQKIKELSSSSIKCFLDAYRLGDGSTRQFEIYTSSGGMVNDLQELAIKAGFNSTISSRNRIGENGYVNKQGHKYKSNYEEYKIYINNRKSAWLLPRFFSIINYNGIVYSIEVPNHVTYLRRNKKTFFGGTN